VYPTDLTYEIYADKLYSNRASVELDYTFKPEVTACPAYFCTLLTYAMARDMVKALSESDQAVQVMNAKYISQRDRALYADAQGRPSKPIAGQPFVDIR
jgi:hypothetical protein